MTPISDETLLAYIDGDLSPEDSVRVDEALAASPETAARLQAIRTRLNTAFDPTAKDARPRHAARKAAPVGAVVSLEAARAKRAEPKAKPASARPARPAINARWGAIAAALVVGIGLGVFAPRPETGLVNGEMQATAVLKAGLDSKLASAPSDKGQIQVGVTFRDKADAWCRTFSSKQGVSGVACRQGNGWQVRMVEAAAPGQEAASATSPAVRAAMAAIIKGAPVDARTEKAARAAGWR